MPDKIEAQSSYLHSISHNLSIAELESEHWFPNNNFSVPIYHFASLGNAVRKIGFLKLSKIDVTPGDTENQLVLPKSSASAYHLMIGGN